jgi:hypothetical protein
MSIGERIDYIYGRLMIVTAMNLQQKTNAISVLIFAASLIIAAIAYFVFHIFFLVIIFVSSLTYYLLSKRRDTSDGYR